MIKITSQNKKKYFCGISFTRNSSCFSNFYWAAPESINAYHTKTRRMIVYLKKNYLEGLSWPCALGGTFVICPLFLRFCRKRRFQLLVSKTGLWRNYFISRINYRTHTGRSTEYNIISRQVKDKSDQFDTQAPNRPTYMAHT